MAQVKGSIQEKSKGEIKVSERVLNLSLDLATVDRDRFNAISRALSDFGPEYDLIRVDQGLSRVPADLLFLKLHLACVTFTSNPHLSSFWSGSNADLTLPTLRGRMALVAK